MSYQSLGEFIKAADKVGEVRYVEDADLDLEVGCLTELMAERNGPMLMFHKFSNYAPGYGVCSNAIPISSPVRPRHGNAPGHSSP